MSQKSNGKKIDIANINIEDKYSTLSDIEHILLRPGMYVGDMNYDYREINLYKPSTNKIETVPNVAYNSAMLKLFDEVIQNSVDVHLDSNALFPVTEIDVTIKGDVITVRDNGGIPVKRHKITKMMLPQMIFGTLRSSGNYNEERSGVGLNGVGSKITNVFSKSFQVITCDTSKKFQGNWSNNMRSFDEKITDCENGEHYTEISWNIDFDLFADIDSLDLSINRLIQKRCIDAAATCPNLLINFKSDIRDGILNSSWQFPDFKNYVLLHTKDSTNFISYSNSKDAVVIMPSIGYNFGFVNSGVCHNGTHIKKIQTQLHKKILDVLKSNNIDLITPRDIDNHISIFCKTNLLNPDYSSQDKTTLTNKISFSSLNIPKEFLDELNTDSEIIKSLIDYYNVKYLAEKKKQTRKLNKMLTQTKTKKLIKCSGRDVTKNELWIFEGDSAKNGFRNASDSTYQAAYLLRGKVKNVLNLTPDKIVENLEYRELIAAQGLLFNEPKKNLKNFKFDKIIFATDADTDGAHICGLLLVFYVTFFPELVKAGKIYRVLSPIIIAKKGKKEVMFYRLDDYHKVADQYKSWHISYKKGLGALEDHHYNDMVQNKQLEQFVLNDNYMDTIKTWFDKSTAQRKEIIAIESGYTTDDD